MKLEFSRQIFSKNTQISNFMKIRPVGAEFHADDDDEANIRFSQFCESTKMSPVLVVSVVATNQL
jgi:hypothetical protein